MDATEKSNGALALREPTPLKAPANFAPRNFAEALDFCNRLAQTSFVPKEFRGKPGEILAAIQFGAEIGVGPLQSLQNIAVINGKPSVYGDLALALVQSSGLLEYIEEADDGKRATCKVKRLGEPHPHVATFSDEDAKRAGLLGKTGPWTQYPARMRMFRARGFALRDKFADVLKGLITREEAEDYPVRRAGAENPPAGAPEPAIDTSAALVDEATGEVILNDSDLASPQQRKAFWEMVKRAQGEKAETWLKNRCMELNGSPDGKKLTIGQIKQLTEMLADSQESPAADDDLNASFEREQEAKNNGPTA